MKRFVKLAVFSLTICSMLAVEADAGIRCRRRCRRCCPPPCCTTPGKPPRGTVQQQIQNLQNQIDILNGQLQDHIQDAVD